MIKVGIIGGDGYSAGELIRLLVNHPDVEINFIQSTSHAGAPLATVHAGLYGDTSLRFSPIAPLNQIDLLFCCTTNGESRKFLENNDVPDKLKIIDLSADYRIEAPGNSFVYGVPELNRRLINRGHRVANPGSVATALLLALYPLAKNLLLNGEIHATAVIGSTVEEQTASQTTQINWQSENISAYKPFEHQDIAEIRQSLQQVQQSFGANLNLIPLRGDFTRGIFASIYLDCPLPLEEIQRLYHEYYDDHSFTFIVAEKIDLKQVVNTNKSLLHLEKHGKKLLILSVIDNLLKGAAGQAVHNMNLLFGLQERTGLNLKSSAF